MSNSLPGHHEHDVLEMELSQPLDLVSVQFVLLNHLRLLASPHEFEDSLKLFSSVDRHSLVEMV